MKKLFALFLALTMLLTMSAAALADGYPAVTFASDYTGKTIILHSNDVHGAIDGYAYIPTLRQWFTITAHPMFL